MRPKKTISAGTQLSPTTEGLLQCLAVCLFVCEQNHSTSWRWTGWFVCLTDTCIGYWGKLIILRAPQPRRKDIPRNPNFDPTCAFILLEFVKFGMITHQGQRKIFKASTVRPAKEAEGLSAVILVRRGMWPMGCWDACSWFFDVEVKKNKATREKWRFSGVSPLTTGEPREVYPSYTFRRPSTFYYIELPNPPSGPMTELPPYPSCNAIWVCGPRFPNALPLKHFQRKTVACSVTF